MFLGLCSEWLFSSFLLPKSGMALGTRDSVIAEITRLIDWQCSYIQAAIFTFLFCFSFIPKSIFVLVKMKQTVSVWWSPFLVISTYNSKLVIAQAMGCHHRNQNAELEESLNCLQYFFNCSVKLPWAITENYWAVLNLSEFVYAFVLKASIYSHSAFRQGIYWKIPRGK